MKGFIIIMEDTLKSFNRDKLASDVFLSKYALKDDKGNVLEHTLADTVRRLNNAIKEVDSENDFSDVLGKYFMPGGRIVYALGNEYDKTSSLSNCYVVDSPSDSLEKIFDTAKKQARIFSRGGGVGFDLSKLRPKGAKVNNSAKFTTGAISFMDLFSQVTGLIAQMGRRGALMLSMSCFDENTFVLVKNNNNDNSEWIKIKTLIQKIENNEKYQAWTENGFFDIIDTQVIENKELYEIETENGKKISVTADHKFVVKNIKTNQEYLKELINIDPVLEELVMYLDE